MIPLQRGRVPGALGMSWLSGHPAGLRIRTPILGNIWTKGAQKAASELGKDLLKLALRRAGSRLAGKILIESKAWQKAFLHIAEHFTLDLLKEKASHTIFTAALRNRTAVERLIITTVKGPSHRAITRATIDGVAAGRPVIILERVFQEVIGEEFKRQGGELVLQNQCKILRVIIDITGRPVTAYPVSALFGA
jgi:hypothetical protein